MASGAPHVVGPRHPLCSSGHAPDHRRRLVPGRALGRDRGAFVGKDASHLVGPSMVCKSIFFRIDLSLAMNGVLR